MDTPQINDPAALDRALQAPSFLLLKHSRTCPISARAWEEYHDFVEQHGDIETGWIDVVANADLSKRVADRTGVPHESPQALWVRKGRVGWHASHLDITAEALERALMSLPKEKKGA